MVLAIDYLCPGCSTPIDDPIHEDDRVRCDHCRRRFRVFRDEQTQLAALVEIGADVRPLGFPPGSVRGAVTLALAGSCWWLILQDRAVSGSLLSVMLAVVGYYFGLRARPEVESSGALDVHRREFQPLRLPGGAIRFILTVGFGICAIALHQRGELDDDKYAEFFTVLVGLVFGYVTGRAMHGLRGTLLGSAASHLAALLVLAATGLACYVFVTGRDWELPLLWIVGLCAFISFYFGKRS